MPEKYEYGIDFARVDAIDIHTHVEVDSHGHRFTDDELSAATQQFFKLGPGRTLTVDALAEHYRERNIAAVVCTIDAQSATGHPPNSVEDLVEGAARNNDILIPFGTVDPWIFQRAVRRVRTLVSEYGVKVFKFHPSMQAFEPNDRRFYPIYAEIAEAGVPALFHTGQTGRGAALAGGDGVKRGYAHPL